MHILVSNDDGISALGLNVLVEALRASGHTVTIVAPHQDCSGMSQALTLRHSIVTQRLDEHRVSVSGTPADCVHIALNALLNQSPDWVISGINHGENLGSDVGYSGTVGAATEAYLSGIPALAISLAGNVHFATAAEVACRLIQISTDHPLLLNVNVPDRPKAQLLGQRLTRQGRRQSLGRPSMVGDVIPGGMSYRIGPPMPPMEHSMDLDVDFGAVQAGYVSVTPLSDHRTTLNDWAVLTALYEQ